MKINLAKLWKEQQGAKEEFSFIREDWSEDLGDVSLSSPLQIKGAVVNQGSFLELFLKIKTEVLLHCSRCLDEVKLPLDLDITEQYCSQEVSANVESNLADFENVEDWLDLKQIVQENLLLSLPMRVLCTPDCPGICPKCGRNLKVDQCDCRQENFDPRFAVLAQLKKKMES